MLQKRLTIVNINGREIKQINKNNDKILIVFCDFKILLN